MIIKLALIISVLLQFTAAVIAVTLIRRTRTNIAWWMISTAFVLMALRRAIELLRFSQAPQYSNQELWQSWIAVIISFLMLFSLIFIRRIFDVQKKYEELKKEHERKIISAVIETEERERKHFARELHDGLGPILSAIKMGFSVLSAGITAEKDKKLADNTSHLIDQSLISLKEVSNNLSPRNLTDHGLSMAIEGFIANLEPDSQNKIIFNAEISASEVSAEKSLTLYRIICELLINGIKHSKAERITLNISKRAHTLFIEYFDNGIGFSANEWIHPTGMGLSNISSRAKSINAELICDSQEGNGTRITITSEDDNG